jgi:hypothetical protein
MKIDPLIDEFRDGSQLVTFKFAGEVGIKVKLAEKRRIVRIIFENGYKEIQFLVI